MRRLFFLGLVVVACGGARAADSAPRAPVASSSVDASRSSERIVPSGPYPVVFALADNAAQTRMRTAFLKANPGWEMTEHPTGRFVVASPPAPVQALGTETGARAFVDANATTLGVDSSAFAHPTFKGNQTTFDTTWGRYTLAGFTVSPTSASGVFLGPLGTPPRELDDETLIRLIAGRNFDFEVTMTTTYHPCDPGPRHSGCPGAPPPPRTSHMTVLVDRSKVEAIHRRVIGVSRPSDPTRWELRIIAALSVKVDAGRCDHEYTSPNDIARTSCEYHLVVDGRPTTMGFALDAITGEPLFDRAFILQASSDVTTSFTTKR